MKWINKLLLSALFLFYVLFTGPYMSITLSQLKVFAKDSLISSKSSFYFFQWIFSVSYSSSSFNDVISVIVFFSIVFLFLSAVYCYFFSRAFNVLFAALVKLTMAKLFAIVGDSNVRPHMSSLNCRANPAMASAVVKTCGRIEAFSETLRSIPYTVSVIILACITNYITSCEPVSSVVSLRVEPVLREFREIVLDFCSEFPER